jgi:alkanesulfonate monooxygenase SsuD/methylene tetrahydromethanopterin reductase-like flavin-dependent oxidoreductase (luciferase family)
VAWLVEGLRDAMGEQGRSRAVSALARKVGAMRYGFVVPFADALEFADLARLGEARGWDAIFTWEALWGVDAWVTLGAAAMVTDQIKLGTLLTPVSRHKPWDLASKVLTVDAISGGRTIMGAGLGALHDGWLAFEPDEGRKARAEKLDEALAIYAGLMAGQPFSYEGKHYQARPTDFMLPAPPVHKPHPPVWVVGAKIIGRDRQPSLERAARWDGLLPAWVDPDDPNPGSGGVFTPERMASIVADVRTLRQDAGLPWEGYDVILEADSTGGFVKTESMSPDEWAAAGATWWIESWWTIEDGAAGRAEVRRRVELGPPPW